MMDITGFNLHRRKWAEAEERSARKLVDDDLQFMARVDAHDKLADDADDAGLDPQFMAYTKQELDDYVKAQYSNNDNKPLVLDLERPFETLVNTVSAIEVENEICDDCGQLEADCICVDEDEVDGEIADVVIDDDATE